MKSILSDGSRLPSNVSNDEYWMISVFRLLKLLPENVDMLRLAV